MAFEDYFPVWDKLTDNERELLKQSAVRRTIPKGTVQNSSPEFCVGLLIIRSGQLRAFIISEDGKEVTLYRLFERDMCLFSASCMINSIQFEISLEAEKETGLWVVPTDVYKQLMESSTAVANFTNELMAARFSEVMWLMEQILWKRFDERLASFLLEESNLEGGNVLKITHERIAAHLGTAREVVTRMLQHFQSEGLVALARGTVELTDEKRLRKLSE